MAQLDTNETAEQLELLLAGSDRRIMAIRVDRNGLTFNVRVESPNGGPGYTIRLKSKEGVEIEVFNTEEPIGKITI